MVYILVSVIVPSKQKRSTQCNRCKIQRTGKPWHLSQKQIEEEICLFLKYENKKIKISEVQSEPKDVFLILISYTCMCLSLSTDMPVRRNWKTIHLCSVCACYGKSSQIQQQVIPADSNQHRVYGCHTWAGLIKSPKVNGSHFLK